MSALVFQITTFLTNLLVVGLVVYYFFKLRKREKELEKKEGKVDTDYHQIVENALTKERKILEDATNEADQIITSAQYITQTSKEIVNQALQSMATTIEKETVDTARNYMTNYQNSLGNLSNQSLNNFQEVTRQLEADLQKQVQDFNSTLLPNLEKELETYKQSRIKTIEQTINRIIQIASLEILNKSISLEDHKNLMIESLEKAKKEGVFD